MSRAAHPQHRTPRPNARIGAYYATGAVVLGAGAYFLRPWAYLALWPALALVVIAAGYFGLGHRVYGKSRGRLPLARRALLAPVLVGQWLSWRHYARQSRAWDVVAPRVWLGRRLTEHEARDAISAGVTAVLDLTAESSAPPAFRALGDATTDPAYLSLPVLDLTAPADDVFRRATAFISAHVARGGVIYVHCKAGYSRSGAVVGAWLIASGNAASAADAIAILRRRRPGIVLRPEAIGAIESWEAMSAPRNAHPHPRPLPRTGEEAMTHP